MWRIALVCVTAMSTAGCFLPISHTNWTSATVVGQYWQEDGTPAAGAQVAITTDPRDATCTRARVRTTTDAAGVFRLPATSERRRWILVFPPFEHFWNVYWLCAGPADTLLRVGYRGLVAARAEVTPRDSLECLEWRWQDSMRVTCSGGHQEGALQSGGRWTVGADSGFYRLILTEEGPLVGPDGRFMRPRLIVQWVQQDFARDQPVNVRATVALPAGERFRSLRELRNPLLVRTDEGWCLSIYSRGWRAIGSGTEMLAFELGPPGQLSPVSSCR